ncbi:MAG: FAD-binding oxidoreductase [Acidobacteriota bacterium]
MVGNQSIEAFKTCLCGTLLRSGDEGYDAARKIWNGMIDKRPALIARCTGAADVIACVRFAREHDLPVSIRGGGHDLAGNSVSDGGLMIDLSPMKGIRVDPVRQQAQAEPGLRLGEFDRETQAFGLATTLGVNTDTGIAGLTLGGGYGWLGGKYGLACDNLISVDIVTAEGRLLHASAEENPDLFWGVRGAGANLGIVTSFEYRLHPVGPVLGGMVLYPLAAAREVLRLFDEFSQEAPDELTTIGALLMGPDGKPAVAAAACYCGPLDAGEKLMKPLKTFAQPVADLIAPQPYVRMQTLFDAAFPPGRFYYSKAHNVRSLGDGAVDVLVAAAEALPTSYCAIALQQLHGAAGRVPVGETAFPHRYVHYDAAIESAAVDRANCEKIIEWTRTTWRALEPFAERAVYANVARDAGEEGQERVREAFGQNFDRLLALKNQYDPTNFFRPNANIKPAAQARSA